MAPLFCSNNLWQRQRGYLFRRNLGDATALIDDDSLAKQGLIMGLGRTTDATNAGVLIEL